LRAAPEVLQEQAAPEVLPDRQAQQVHLPHFNTQGE
jgi:hypothetical protein